MTALKKTLENILLGISLTSLNFAPLLANSHALETKRQESKASSVNSGFIKTWHDWVAAAYNGDGNKAKELWSKIEQYDQEIEEIDLSKTPEEISKQFEKVGYANFGCYGPNFGKIIDQGKLKTKFAEEEKEAEYVRFDSDLVGLQQKTRPVPVCCTKNNRIYINQRVLDNQADNFYRMGKEVENIPENERTFIGQMIYLHYKDLSLKLKESEQDRESFRKEFSKNHFETTVKYHEGPHLYFKGTLEESEKFSFLNELAEKPSYAALALLGKAQTGFLGEPYEKAAHNLFNLFEKKGLSKKELRNASLEEIGKAAKSIFSETYEKK